MVAVVTGAAGFIGTVLVDRLAATGPVIGVDRLPQHPRPGLTAITADLLDHDPAVEQALATADVVFHLAGCPDVRDPRPDADRHRFRDNVLATAAVLGVVRRDAALLVTSSSSVYGGTVPGRGCHESDGLRPRGGYARSKRLVEELCAGRRDAGGTVTVIRPFTVAGEGQRPGMGLSRWIAAARAGRPLTIFGSPERSRDITDVQAAARALIELAGIDTPATVNIGTGRAHTLREMAETVCRVVGADLRLECTAGHPDEVEHTLADVGALGELLGWVPATDLADLVARQHATMPAGPVAIPG